MAGGRNKLRLKKSYIIFDSTPEGRVVCQHGAEMQQRGSPPVHGVGRSRDKVHFCERRAIAA